MRGIDWWKISIENCWQKDLRGFTNCAKFSRRHTANITGKKRYAPGCDLGTADTDGVLGYVFGGFNHDFWNIFFSDVWEGQPRFCRNAQKSDACCELGRPGFLGNNYDFVIFSSAQKKWRSSRGQYCRHIRCPWILFGGGIIMSFAIFSFLTSEKVNQ